MQEDPGIINDTDTPPHSWMDMVPLDTKYNIAFWFEYCLLAFAQWTVLAPNKFRRLLGVKPGWNETTPKTSLRTFDWFSQRSSLAWITHSLYWLLFDAVGMEPTVVFALAGIPFALSSFHSLLNQIPKECGFSNRADLQVLSMTITNLFLLYTGSPYLVLAERVSTILTVAAGLLLYLSPALVAWIYGMPNHFAEERVIAHHMNCYGYSLLVMTALGSALVWSFDDDHDHHDDDDMEDSHSAESRESMLAALAISLLLSVVGFSPLVHDLQLVVAHAHITLLWLVVILGVGVTLMFL